MRSLLQQNIGFLVVTSLTVGCSAASQGPDQDGSSLLGSSGAGTGGQGSAPIAGSGGSGGGTLQGGGGGIGTPNGGMAAGGMVSAGTNAGGTAAGGMASGGMAAGGMASGGMAAGGMAAGGMGTGGQPAGGPYNNIPRGRSAGCGMFNGTDQPGNYTHHNVAVTGVDPYWLTERTPYPGQVGYSFEQRSYAIRLPQNYDETRAYPLIFQGGGCGNTDGTSGANGGRQMLPEDSAADAITVGLSYVYPDGAGACFADEGAFVDGEYKETIELPYFDAVYNDIISKNCVDLEKVFIGGYSSGAWMAYTIGYARSGVIRGIGTGAGGKREHRPTPSPGIPYAAWMITGINDGPNPIHRTKDGTSCNGTEAEGCWNGQLICDDTPATDCHDTGSGAAREEILTRNGCIGRDTQPHMVYQDCDVYTGCPEAFPVVYCAVEGEHTDGGDRLNPGAWDFWSSLPPVP